MLTRELTICNHTGLHARPASLFVACARKFSSEITVSRPDTGQTVNAKSIMKLLALGATYKTRILVSADGEDETAAIEAIDRLVSSAFGENHVFSSEVT